MNLSPAATARLLDVARAAIRAKLAGQTSAPPGIGLGDESRLASELAQLAGCFVSLHAASSGRLRGCVGRLDATLPVLLAVHQSAENVLDDPRFVAGDAVRGDELADLELEISILSPPRPAPSPLAFDPLEHGIYLTLDGRTGCFLPQVARETGWTREQLLDRLCTEKLGLPATAWERADAKLSVFSVLVLGPEPFVSPAVRVDR